MSLVSPASEEALINTRIAKVRKTWLAEMIVIENVIPKCVERTCKTEAFQDLRYWVWELSVLFRLAFK